MSSKIERRLEVRNMQRSLFHGELADLRVIERIHHRLVCLPWAARMRLVRRAVGVDDQVEFRPLDLSLAQDDVRWRAKREQPQYSHLQSQPIHMRVRSLICRLEPMNRNPRRLRSQMQQIPVKCAHLDAPASQGFEL